MKDISIYGAGGHCYAIVELIRSSGKYTPKAIYDDSSTTDSILGISVQSDRNQLISGDALCMAIGNNEARKKLVAQLPMEYPSFVHASAVVYPSATIGQGTMIFPLAVIDAAVQIGNHCIINNHATVSHNVIIEDFAHVAIQAAIAGGVIIGEGTLVGAGSIILPDVKIGRWATIGAGAVVTKDVADHAVVFGNPARIQQEGANPNNQTQNK